MQVSNDIGTNSCLVFWSPVFHFPVCNDLKQSVTTSFVIWKLLASSQRYLYGNSN